MPNGWLIIFFLLGTIKKIYGEFTDFFVIWAVDHECKIGLSKKPCTKEWKIMEFCILFDLVRTV